jgi:hypothetical protein
MVFALKQLLWCPAHYKVTLTCFGRDGLMNRGLDAILPNEFSASYRRLVQRDFTDDEDVAGYTVTGDTEKEKKQTKKDYGALTELLTHVNMTRDGMDEDEHFVLPVNFSAVGCILLQFTNVLSEHMVRSCCGLHPSRAKR